MNLHVTLRAIYRAACPRYSMVPLTVVQLFSFLTSGCHKLWQDAKEPWKSFGPEINFRQTGLDWRLLQS